MTDNITFTDIIRLLLILKCLCLVIRTVKTHSSNTIVRLCCRVMYLNWDFILNWIISL
jgi:hypothetical protein